MNDGCLHLKDTARIKQDVDHLTSGAAIEGCCGHQCYVITEIRFCPFCGVPLNELGEPVEAGIKVDALAQRLAILEQRIEALAPAPRPGQPIDPFHRRDPYREIGMDTRGEDL